MQQRQGKEEKVGEEDGGGGGDKVWSEKNFYQMKSTLYSHEN